MTVLPPTCNCDGIKTIDTPCPIHGFVKPAICPSCGKSCYIVFSDDEVNYGTTISDCCEMFIDKED